MKYSPSTPPAPPEWMKVRLPFATGEPSKAGDVREKVTGAGLHTVCEEASCPNLGHCWSQGTATFLVMGDRCTRRCGFCDISTARPLPLDVTEPMRLAETVQKMNLRHVVITSVDRDELPDCGSAHFASCITETKRLNPNTTIEVLIPDFKAEPASLERIFAARPHIINHNIETVPSLFKTICPQSNYSDSVDVLRQAASAGFMTKTGLILGLGETRSEVEEVMKDARTAGVRLLTIGQYLQPSAEHAPLMEYISPETFGDLKIFAQRLGFSYVESGPLVRSSYHAGDALDFLLQADAGTADHT